MLNDFDCFWQTEWHPQEYKGVDKKDYAIYAICIDNEVVDVCAYKKSFIELYINNEFIEREQNGSRFIIDVVNNGQVIETIDASNRLGSIFLSNPIVIPLTVEDDNIHAVIGMQLINGKIIFS